jgi:hypothetical protein
MTVIIAILLALFIVAVAMAMIWTYGVLAVIPLGLGLLYGHYLIRKEGR